MKKWWVWAILVVAVLVVYGAATGVSKANKELKEEDTAEAVAESESEEVENESADLSREEEIQALVSDIVEDKLMATDVLEVAVNPDMGSDSEGFVVQPKFEWGMSNNADRTKSMLEEYSDHLAAVLTKESDINKLTVFWEVPYHLKGENAAKFSYYQEDGQMIIEDMWFSPEVK